MSNRIVNGFCVCGFVLSVLGFVSVASAYLAPYFFQLFRVSPPGRLVLHLLFLRAPLLMLTATVFSLVGVRTCDRHAAYRGKRLGLVGATLGFFVLAFWLITVVFTRLNIGYPV